MGVNHTLVGRLRNAGSRPPQDTRLAGKANPTGTPDRSRRTASCGAIRRVLPEATPGAAAKRWEDRIVEALNAGFGCHLALASRRTPMPMLRPVTAALAIVAVAGIAGTGSADTDLQPPTGYRQWFHVNTMVIDKTSPLFASLGGMHNVSVNAVGLPALRKGTAFPDKTMFVSDLHEFTVNDGSYVEGDRKVLALMVKDAKKYATTGGWGFQAWAGGDPKKPVVTDPTKECFDCHESQKAHDYVFSTYIP
jgi:hypothetical protein